MALAPLIRRLTGTEFLEMAMRARARRVIANSWILSKWYYRLNGLRLMGRASDTVWYFAYGSNMHDSTFRERRRMRPLEWRIGRLKGYRLRFNLDGIPRGKSAPANIYPDVAAEVWGVLYRITHREMLFLNLSEGVPGKVYRPMWLNLDDSDGRSIKAMTYIATGNETDGRPSLRYIALLRDGARAHGLPSAWLETLDSVTHAD
jgi:cation transport regulator ChaC